VSAYFKVSGGGNDFLALIEPAADPTAVEIAAWCRRGLSLGADGLMVLRRQSPGTLRMDYWNADGRPADLCLNGTRCAARLAFELGWAAETATVVTGAGAVAARALPDARVDLALPPPRHPPEARAPVVDGEARPGHYVVTGVPHFVLLWPHGLAAAPVRQLGRSLRRHPAFGPAGANVDFARFPGPGELEVRTFERGVEDETLACGTGVLAAAAVGVELGIARLPLTALTAGGFRFEVGGDSRPGAPAGWRLAGDARLLARGEVLPDASRVPAAPQWSAADQDPARSDTIGRRS
jgi:diaminopimelate epimerase